MRDVKDVVGIIMRVLDGAEISEDGVLDVEFDADGAVLAVLDEACIMLLAFVHDHDRRLSDRQLDQNARGVAGGSWADRRAQRCGIQLMRPTFVVRRSSLRHEAVSAI